MSDGMMCCPLTGGDDDGPSAHWVTTPRARKPHLCSECREMIPVGAQYERFKGVWDGSFDEHLTCASCVEIRSHFACNGWIFGRLWEDIEENFFPSMKAGGPCMEGLSPQAKQRLFDLRLAWLEERAS